MKIYFRTQSESFQASTKFATTCGQFVGMIPFVSMMEEDISQVRFKWRSVRFTFSVLMCIAQMSALVLSLFRLLSNAISVAKLGYFSFYSSTSLTCIVFLRLAWKWQHLMQRVSTADLNEYIDPHVQFKCNCAASFIIGLGFFEHLLSIIAGVSSVLDCHSRGEDLYRKYIEQSYPWLFEARVPYSIIFGIILPILNLASTVIWSYSDLFLVCVSYFLSSILKQINNKIMSSAGEYLPPSHWRKLREDYSRATKLVRSFDDVINNIVFASFASNLFFVCLRLYHMLAPFRGHEEIVYLSFSLAFVLFRSLAVSLAAASVHSASLVPAPCLYDVPAPAYCAEVQRFIEQVHGDIVALSGLNFFHVTKELVLSIAGTIITYELVLLQFNG